MNLGLLPLAHNVHRLDLDATAVQGTSGLIHVFEAALRRVRRVAVYCDTQERMASISSTLLSYIYIYKYGLVPSYWKCVKSPCIVPNTLSTFSLSCSREI